MKLGLGLMKVDVADPRLRCSPFRGQGSRDCLIAFHGTVTRDILSTAMSSASHRDHDDQRLSSISNASAPHSAGTPFDDLDADLVIQSHDLIEFRVHRYLLQLVSPVFKDMLSMPQPLASRTRSASSRNESVKLPESSCTLRLLLSYCDPRIPNPDVDGLTLDQVSEVLDSGIKYQMECIKNDIVPKLQSSVVHIRENPLHVYAIGVKIHLLGAVGGRAVAKLAAVELLKHKVPFTLSLKGSEEFRTLPAEYLEKLYIWHTRCRDRVLNRLENPDKWCRRSWLRLHEETKCKCDRKYRVEFMGLKKMKVGNWWLELWEEIEEMLKSMPHPTNVLKAHKEFDFEGERQESFVCDECVEGYYRDVPTFLAKVVSVLTMEIEKVRVVPV
jgi:hypothetical protein